MTYMEIAEDLVKEMIHLDIDTLTILNNEFQKDLERQQASEKLKKFCRLVTETVINYKREQESVVVE